MSNRNDVLIQVIREDLGSDPDELFRDFVEEPLGTASLAQVHKAKLQDGREVAVKVQHRFVKNHSFVDIYTMDFLVHTVKFFFPQFEFMWLAEVTLISYWITTLGHFLEFPNESVPQLRPDHDGPKGQRLTSYSKRNLLFHFQEMRKNLPLELSFIQEGKNSEKIAQLLGHHKWLVIPKISWKHSTERVLVMEYCKGKHS